MWETIYTWRQEAGNHGEASGDQSSFVTWIFPCKLPLETAVSVPFTCVTLYIPNISIFDFILIHPITSWGLCLVYRISNSCPCISKSRLWGKGRESFCAVTLWELVEAVPPPLGSFRLEGWGIDAWVPKDLFGTGFAGTFTVVICVFIWSSGCLGEGIEHLVFVQL